MKNMIKSLLIERNVEVKNFSYETLYKVGMENVRDNIEFYFDKTEQLKCDLKALFLLEIILQHSFFNII